MDHPHLKVLVVDDADLVVQRVFKILEESHCVEQMFKANNYYQAQNLIESASPDVMLLDIHLPGKNGLDLLEYVKKQHPEIKVIMLTNMVSNSYKVMCNELGADHFVDKSTDFEKIPGLIESYLPVPKYLT